MSIGIHNSEYCWDLNVPLDIKQALMKWIQWQIENKFRYRIIVLHCNAWSNYLSILLDRHVLHLMYIDINMNIVYLLMSTVRTDP